MSAGGARVLKTERRTQMVEKTFGILMRERADQATKSLLAPKPKPVVHLSAIDILLVRIKSKIEMCVDEPSYYCSYTLYGVLGNERGILRSREEALAMGPRLVERLEAEGIEARLVQLIGGVSLDLAWRPERSLDDDYET